MSIQYNFVEEVYQGRRILVKLCDDRGQLACIGIHTGEIGTMVIPPDRPEVEYASFILSQFEKQYPKIVWSIAS